jgi:hypothetical protein
LLALFGACIAACLPTALTPDPTLSDRRPFRLQATGGKVYTAFPATTGQSADFKDATGDISPVPAWLFSGKWSLLSGSSGFSGGVYHQDETGPYPHVTIRRYGGTAFGSNGALPAKYRISGALQPFAMADHMPPIGENGFLVYYRNPRTYVELVVSGGNVAVWSCDNAGPDGSAGWKGWHWFGQKTNAGDIRRLEAEIDTNAHTITTWVEGVKAASLTIPLLANTPGHTFALRSIGNKINVGELLVQDLTGGTPPPAPSPTPKPSATPQPQVTATAVPQPVSGLTFKAVGNLPQGRVWHGAALAGNGQVYLSGGTNGASGFTTVWSSPLSQPWGWQTRTGLPQATEGHGFAVIGGYAYTLGGWTRGSGGPRADVYKAAIGSDGTLGPWTATTALPAGRVYAGWVVDGQSLIAIGGLGPNWGPATTVWQAKADAQGNLSGWQTAAALPEPRAWPGCAVVGGKLWVTGGSAGKLTKSTTFAASYGNGQIGAWQAGPALPRALEAQATVVLKGVLTLCGGDDYSSGTPSPTAAVYQLTGGTWKTVGQLPVAGFAQMPVVSGNSLYLFGGHDAAHHVLSSIWKATF